MIGFERYVLEGRRVGEAICLRTEVPWGRSKLFILSLFNWTILYRLSAWAAMYRGCGGIRFAILFTVTDMPLRGILTGRKRRGIRSEWIREIEIEHCCVRTYACSSLSCD